MALSNTLVINWAGENKTLVKVNQDNYTSQYRLKTSDVTNIYLWEAFIRHTSTKPDKNQIVYDRHNVEIKVSISRIDGTKPTEITRAYIVFEVPNQLPATPILQLGDAIATLVSADAFGESLWAGEV